MVTLDLPVPIPPADAAPPVVPLQTEPLGIDGLVVRPLDPGTDGPRLRAMCPRVSEQSRYQRFFSGIGYLSDSLLALLLDVDHARREALVALQGDEIVAVARYATTTAAPVEADISLLVVDDLQRHGIAKRIAPPPRAARRAAGHPHADRERARGEPAGPRSAARRASPCARPLRAGVLRLPHGGRGSGAPVGLSNGVPVAARAACKSAQARHQFVTSRCPDSPTRPTTRQVVTGGGGRAR